MPPIDCTLAFSVLPQRVTRLTHIRLLSLDYHRDSPPEVPMDNVIIIIIGIFGRLIRSGRFGRVGRSNICHGGTGAADTALSVLILLSVYGD